MRNLNASELRLSADAPFALRLLGPFELGFRQSGALIPVSSAKMRALLAYLAAAPRCSETRRRLAGLLWASSGEDQARQSMRQLLSNFRRGGSLQASGLLNFDETGVSLDPALVAIDRTALMDARHDADVAELARIADLYRDDFGLGLDIGEPEFDAWLHAERIRCRDAAIALFDRLVRALIVLGRHDEALARANRLTEIDPLREETHRLAIAQEAVVSGRASAMQRYEAFRVLLRDELGVRPEAATPRLLNELRRQPVAEVPADIVSCQRRRAGSALRSQPRRDAGDDGAGRSRHHRLPEYIDRWLPADPLGHMIARRRPQFIRRSVGGNLACALIYRNSTAAVSSGRRCTRIMSMRRPSISTTSNRQPPYTQ